MLAADKEALKARLLQQSLEIREKELSFFNVSLNTVGTQAALIAGFAFSGLGQTEFTKNFAVFENGFYIFTTISLTTSLMCVCSAAFVSTLGPGLALRGPQGSMVRAVDITKHELTNVFAAFGVSVVTMFLATICLAWVQMRHLTAGLVSGTLGLCLIYLVRLGIRLRAKFHIPESISIIQKDLQSLEQAFDPSVEHNTALGTQQQQQQNSSSSSSSNHVQFLNPVLPARALLTMQGNLELKGTHQGLFWKQYYFTVEGGEMLYYHSKAEYEQQRPAVINRPIRLADHRLEAGRNGLTFSLVPVAGESGRRSWHLSAYSLMGAGQWITVLRRATEQQSAADPLATNIAVY